MQQTSEEYMRELRDDHGRFSRILSLIGRDARRLVDEPDSVLPLFAEAVDYVVSFQNVYHHPREEIMFARVAEKTASLAEAAALLSREHEATADSGSELLAIMQGISRGSSKPAERQELARRLEKFARSMRTHILKEEELLYSHAWAELEPEDWDDLTKSASSVDPLEGSQEDRFPLLTAYVNEGRTHSRVAMENSSLGQVLETGLKQVDQIGLVHRTLRQQQREAWALTVKSFKAMPLVPILRPATALKVGSESAAEFGRSYMRWLREWVQVYREMKEGP